MQNGATIKISHNFVEILLRKETIFEARIQNGKCNLSKQQLDFNIIAVD